jgi:hypothetical protein
MTTRDTHPRPAEDCVEKVLEVDRWLDAADVVLMDALTGGGYSFELAAEHARSHTRNVALGLAIVPGLLYGLAWLAFGQYAGHGFWTHFWMRFMGAALAVAACNLAWRLLRDTAVWTAFAAYMGCLALTIGLAWVLLAA